MNQEHVKFHSQWAKLKKRVLLEITEEVNNVNNNSFEGKAEKSE